ncbi:TPA: hypothetical protein QH512_004911 [Klebsiella aerogenes]|uniref:hypothetical protein n=2 Tax=Klebsiella quasipneumoniae TaxID=1463165 RepID=UPI001F45C6F4|nr:hypothetical protein [Klebsiella quasipneumoniae]HDS7487972.1 hypothetical protein [Klebsiella aerogenes]MCF2309406.1 hypothetical protein [Klebsiella quasipneumoniae subsp. similipneumoniae]HDE1152152.1 hypothetical protein [Klebsiella quasipneumoniae]HDE2004553.1 hypothetical protein [Klebsiella quasipneumoniae]HDG7716249.1 hypothetical protein [Klebsiella quasipneumoniae]
MRIKNKFLMAERYFHSLKFVNMVHFISNIIVFFSACFSLISTTGYIWDGEQTHGRVISWISSWSSICMLISAITLFWSSVKKDKHAKKKEKIVDHQMMKSLERIEKLKLESESYKLRIEQVKSQVKWRDITDEQVTKLKSMLQGEKIKFFLSFVGSDSESTVYREKLNNAFEGTCVETSFFSGYSRGYGLIFVGQITPEFIKLYNAFQYAGIPIDFHDIENKPMLGEFEIIVGTKPPPILD